MRRGEIYSTKSKVGVRGYRPGFYVVVSRNFVAESEDIPTVVCAPVYTQVLKIRSEVVIGAAEGLPREAAIRCDFLTLIFKRRLTGYVGSLSESSLERLNLALRYAFEIPE